MKGIGTWLVVLGASLFCGIVGFGSGLGDIVLPLNQVARPIVCGNQQLQVNPIHFSSGRGEDFAIEAYCVDNTTGQRLGSDRGILVSFVSGTIYGLIIFGIAAIVIIRNNHIKGNSSKSRT